MNDREKSPDYGSRSKSRPKLEEYNVLAKPRKSKKRPKKRMKSLQQGFSEDRCQGPFWIDSNYRNVTPEHICCGRIHKSQVSKSARHWISKIEEEDEDVRALEKKFEAIKEMKKVEKAKTMDGQENDTVVVKTDLVRFIKAYIHMSRTFFQELDLKDAAKIQLKKTLNDLRKDELEKIDKKLKAKEEIKRVKNAMINREDHESRKLSLVDDIDQVNTPTTPGPSPTHTHPDSALRYHCL